MWQLVVLALTLADGNGAGGTCPCRCAPPFTDSVNVMPAVTPEVAEPASVEPSAPAEAPPKNAIAFNVGVA